MPRLGDAWGPAWDRAEEAWERAQEDRRGGPGYCLDDEDESGSGCGCEPDMKCSACGECGVCGKLWPACPECDKEAS